MQRSRAASALRAQSQEFRPRSFSDFFNNIGGKPSFTRLEQMTDMRQSTVADFRDD
jgi:hypothetical protein